MIPRDKILFYIDKYGDIKTKEDVEILFEQVESSYIVFALIIKDLLRTNVVKCENFFEHCPNEQRGYVFPPILSSLRISLTEIGKDCIKRLKNDKKLFDSGNPLDSVKIDKAGFNLAACQKLSYEDFKNKFKNNINIDLKLAYYLLTGLKISNRLPLVFISYSYDSEQHKKWVKSIAKKIILTGKANVILDQNDFKPGMDVFETMKNTILKVDKVLVVFTPSYKEKAEQNKGGVGYEFSVLQENLFKRISNDKYIPILRTGERKESIPSFMENYFDYDARKGLRISKIIDIILKI